MIAPSCSATTKRSISVSSRSRERRTRMPCSSSGPMIAMMPPTSSIVALRRFASGADAIIVPTPSRVKSSSSSAPSRCRLMRCARLTPLSQARIAQGR